MFEVHFIGLLESTHSMMEKLNQLIVTEEYGRLNAYKQELMGVIIEIEFGLTEYEKQKKGMLQQIELLRMDNDHLNHAINELHTVIEELEREVTRHFERNALDKYIAGG
jgi:chromosome segregation ATPase